VIAQAMGLPATRGRAARDLLARFVEQAKADGQVARAGAPRHRRRRGRSGRRMKNRLECLDLVRGLAAGASVRGGGRGG